MADDGPRSSSPGTGTGATPASAAAAPPSPRADTPTAAPAAPQTAPIPSPDGAAGSASPPPDAGPAAAAADGSGAAGAGGGPDEAFWARVAASDPQELVRRHSRLQGHVGNLAQREAQRITQQQWAAARRAEQVEAARVGDDYRLAALVKPELLSQAEADAALESQRAALREGGLAHRAAARHFEALPPEVAQQLAGRHYPGDEAEAFATYLGDVADALVEHKLAARLAAERQKWEREAAPALQKRALTLALGDEEAPDLGAGLAPANGGLRGRLTPEAIRAMTPAEFTRHEKDIAAALWGSAA